MASSAVNDALGLQLMASAASEPEPEVTASHLQTVAKTTTDQANLSTSKAANAGRPRAMKKCAVDGCESFARSRARCKAHGGGKRCKYQGCELSDQGGGFCIRHGGGKRCEVDGCDKSAQSRRFCKAHGGGVRCKVEGCVKTSQGAGCCRAHGGGPRAKSKKGDAVANDAFGQEVSMRSSKVTRSVDTTNQTPVSQSQAYTTMEPAMTESSNLSCMVLRDQNEENARSSLAFRIQSVSASLGSAAGVPSRPEASKGAAQCCIIDGCGNAVMAGKVSRLCDEHGTSLHFAASLLGMLSTESV